MQKALFDYKDYKTYLSETLEYRAQKEKGQRSRLAEFIGCQPAYLSQVLNGNADLSLEQADSASRFLDHSAQEARFFLFMVLRERAGTKDLKDVFQRDLDSLEKERFNLKNRIKTRRTLSEKDQARYYSSWHYAAIHVLVSLPGFRSKLAIKKALHISSRIMNEAFDFLVSIGLLHIEGNEVVQGETSLHLHQDSPFIQKHHANWRMKALQSLEQSKETDLHYSSVITCSQKDLSQVKEIFIRAVQEIRALIKDSKDETMASYAIDVIDLINESSEID